MAFEPKDNSGVLFKNDRKEKDTHPDYNGSALIDGVDYYMSAWLKDGKKGKFMSFAFKPKNAAREDATRQADRNFEQTRGRAPPRGGSLAEELDDEIPF